MATTALAQARAWSAAEAAVEAVLEREAPKLDTAAVAGQGGIGQGKGAWDCDHNCAIPPEHEALVFEEVPTDELYYEGIPLVPPRQNMTHMVVYLNGCRYRVEAYPDWTVGRLKQALWNGGIQRANRPAEVAATPGLQRWEDLAIAYAHQVMADDKKVRMPAPDVGRRPGGGAGFHFRPKIRPRPRRGLCRREGPQDLQLTFLSPCAALRLPRPAGVPGAHRRRGRQAVRQAALRQGRGVLELMMMMMM